MLSCRGGGAHRRPHLGSRSLILPCPDPRSLAHSSPGGHNLPGYTRDTEERRRERRGEEKSAVCECDFVVCAAACRALRAGQGAIQRTPPLLAIFLKQVTSGGASAGRPCVPVPRRHNAWRCTRPPPRRLLGAGSQTIKQLVLVDSNDLCPGQREGPVAPWRSIARDDRH